MCFGSDNSALVNATNQQTQMLEQQNAQHNATVSQDVGEVNNAFQQFDPNYYNNYQTAYQNNYQPELTDQYNITKDKLTAALAGTDQLGGSAGNNELAQLDKDYAFGQSDIANKAADATNALKGNVANTETGLYNMAENAADPYTMAQAAQAQSGAIVSPQSYPTMASYFSDFLTPLAAGVKANQSSANPVTGTQISNYFAPV